jgi:hypothetical protein
MKEYAVLVERYWQGQIKVFGEKLVPAPLHLLQIPHVLAWD